MFKTFKNRQLLIVMILLISVTVLTSCSFSGTESTEKEFKEFYTEKELLAGAREEGKVVFCTNIPGKVANKFGEAFEEKYDINAEVIRLSSGIITQRFYAEKERRVTTCDVINTGEIGAFPDWKNRGWLEKSSNLPEWENFPERYKDSEGYYPYTRLNMLGLIYNTNLLKPEELPKSLEDIIDPKWKGKLVMADPSIAGSTLLWIKWVVEERGYGLDYLKKLRENDILIPGENGPAYEAVATGKRVLALGIGDVRYKTGLEEGAPIGWAQPSDGYVVAPQPSAIALNAPHPFAAKLLMNYLMSRDGQLIHAEAGMPTARKDVDYLKINPFMGPIENAWEPQIDEETSRSIKEFSADFTNIVIR